MNLRVSLYPLHEALRGSPASVCRQVLRSLSTTELLECLETDMSIAIRHAMSACYGEHSCDALRETDHEIDLLSVMLAELRSRVAPGDHDDGSVRPSIAAASVGRGRATTSRLSA